MRLDRVYIDGFKNLSDLEVDFDESRLTTVLIGQNGAGKSNLIEAIVEVFRHVDLNRGTPRFRYEIDYRLDGNSIRLSNLNGSATITSNGHKVPRTVFEKSKELYFPDLVFGYYSGGSRRLEQLFDSHQRRYYDAIKLNDDTDECRDARAERRLFFCRPIHGIFALLSFFAYPTNPVNRLLQEKLGVTEFHSALAVLREPWFSKGKSKKGIATNEHAHELWGARGPAGRCARLLREHAFHPIAVAANEIDDYREKGGKESQLGVYLRSLDVLTEVAANFDGDADMFAALEAMDISDLVRELHLWVRRSNDPSGDVSFSDLSDGERQLLMVLGLIRISRGKRTLFLLDEPDTHLNPHWQHTYLDLIRDWTEAAADENRFQIIMTSHNPITIAALQREEVRILSADEAGKVTCAPPYTDPRGLGFTATLTEIFGMPTSLDSETQRVIDERNTLARIDHKTTKQQEELIIINDKLNRLGFMFEDREPLYQQFLQAWRDVRYADSPPITPAEAELRRKAMAKLVRELSSSKDGAA